MTYSAKAMEWAMKIQESAAAGAEWAPNVVAGRRRAGPQPQDRAPLALAVRALREEQRFSRAQLRSRTSPSNEMCARAPGGFWIVVDNRDDCVRIYQSSLADRTNPRVIVYLHGDVLFGIRGKTPLAIETPDYTE